MTAGSPPPKGATTVITARRANTMIIVVVYTSTVVAANWATSRYGLVPVGLGLTATAGTYLAGTTFVVRDTLQDVGGRRAVYTAIMAGAALSVLLSTPQLAAASSAAFLVSELVDTAIYTPLRRHGYLRAAIASNLCGSVVDTFVFLALAGFPVTVLSVGGQLAGKTWVTIATALVVATVMGVRCAVLRHRVNRAGA